MKVIPGRTGLPSGYEYRVGGAKKEWKADPKTGQSLIRHLKTFNPLDDFYGQSPLEAAARAIDLRNALDDHNNALVRNQARPSGALVFEPRDKTASDRLAPEQFDRLKAQLADESQGTDNA